MKVLFIHRGRSSHFVHQSLGKTISTNFKSRGKSYSDLIKSFFNSFLSSDKYDIILCSDATSVLSAIPYKLKYGSKISFIAGDPVFYFYNKKFNIFKKIILRIIFLLSDFVVSVGNINEQLAKKFFKNKEIKIWSFPSHSFNHIKPDLKSKNILMITSNLKEKGHEKLIEAVKILNDNKNNFNLFILGNINIKKRYNWLHTPGYVDKIDDYLRKCSIYVHPSDFDTCPTSVFEAMSAGLITIISKNIGQYEIFLKNNLDPLIIDNNLPTAISSKILEIYNFPMRKKKKLSKKLKKISLNYSRLSQIKLFKKKWNTIIKRCF